MKLSNFRITNGNHIGDITNENYVSVIQSIIKKNGVCPLVGQIILAIVPFDTDAEHSKKGFAKSYNSIIESIGYTPKYINKGLRATYNEYYSN